MKNGLSQEGAVVVGSAFFLAFGYYTTRWEREVCITFRGTDVVTTSD